MPSYSLTLFSPWDLAEHLNASIYPVFYLLFSNVTSGIFFPQTKNIPLQRWKDSYFIWMFYNTHYYRLTLSKKSHLSSKQL